MSLGSDHSRSRVRLPKAATLVLHAAKLYERGHPFPKKVAVLEWHEPIWRVDGERRDGGVGASLIEERDRVAFNAAAQHTMLGRPDTARRPLFEDLAKIHDHRCFERRHIDPATIQ